MEAAHPSEQFEAGIEWPDEAVTDDEPAVVEPSVPQSAGSVAPAGVVPLLPAVVARLENVHGAVAALAMRLDAISASTNDLRSLLSDRLTDYAETVTGLTRAQAETIEEYRHANDRTLAELRRTVTESDEIVRGVAGRVNELVTDTSALNELVRIIATDTRATVAGNERLARTVKEGFEQFAGLAALEAELAELRTEVVQLKRRLGVRGRTTVSLDDEQLGVLAERIATNAPIASGLSDGDIDRIVAALAVHFERTFEVVDVPDAFAPPPFDTPPLDSAVADTEQPRDEPSKRRRRS